MTKWEQKRVEQTKEDPVIDLGETEKSFMEQVSRKYFQTRFIQSFAEPPRPSFSNLSVINPSDTFIPTTPRKVLSGPRKN